jgi:hypothetical protein
MSHPVLTVHSLEPLDVSIQVPHSPLQFALRPFTSVPSAAIHSRRVCNVTWTCAVKADTQLRAEVCVCFPDCNWFGRQLTCFATHRCEGTSTVRQCQLKSGSCLLQPRVRITWSVKKVADFCWWARYSEDTIYVLIRHRLALELSVWVKYKSCEMEYSWE